MLLVGLMLHKEIICNIESIFCILSIHIDVFDNILYDKAILLFTMIGGAFLLMKDSHILINQINEHKHDDLFADIYVDANKIEYQRNRYISAIKEYERIFASGMVEVYSAPGRSEIGGNHTDHQHGEVLAASINQDVIAIVKKTDDNLLRIVSDKQSMITIDLSHLEKNEEEEGTTLSIIKGVLAGMKNHNYNIGGFQAYITSDVLIGAGLSSSAAFETIIGTILSGLYNNMEISPTDIAIIGQYAENVYFGKPCGLMDQMACSVGSLVHIDFAKPNTPAVTRVEFDFDKQGYSLCITDTKGSHADLTSDYAAVPAEMKQVAAYFGKKYLCEIKKEDLYANIEKIRKQTGDRAVLRAIHFFEENTRVQQEVNALKSGDFQTFLNTVRASGDSSFKYLQNVYTNHDVAHQNVSVALAISDTLLKESGVSRVHGGGFAGTIQAFVKNTTVNEYQKAMNEIFGESACSVLKIRKYGGMKVF